MIWKCGQVKPCRVGQSAHIAPDTIYVCVTVALRPLPPCSLEPKWVTEMLEHQWICILIVTRSISELLELRHACCLLAG